VVEGRPYSGESQTVVIKSVLNQAGCPIQL
jgi:hypothetical protein